MINLIHDYMIMLQSIFKNKIFILRDNQYKKIKTQAQQPHIKLWF